MHIFNQLIQFSHETYLLVFICIAPHFPEILFPLKRYMLLFCHFNYIVKFISQELNTFWKN